MCLNLISNPRTPGPDPQPEWKCLHPHVLMAIVRCALLFEWPVYHAPISMCSLWLLGPVAIITNAFHNRNDLSVAFFYISFVRFVSSVCHMISSDFSLTFYNRHSLVCIQLNENTNTDVIFGRTEAVLTHHRYNMWIKIHYSRYFTISLFFFFLAVACCCCCCRSHSCLCAFLLFGICSHTVPNCSPFKSSL